MVISGTYIYMYFGLETNVLMCIVYCKGEGSFVPLETVMVNVCCVL